MNVIVPIMLFSFFGGLVLERFLRGRPQPVVKNWTLRCVATFVAGGLFNATLPAYLAKRLAGHNLIDIRGLGLVPGVVVFALTSMLGLYWVHRAYHRSDFLWRWVHQMHHSAERVDLAGWVYGHPFEFVMNATTGTITMAIFRAEVETTVIGTVFTVFLGMFAHLNTSTPRWLGYFVQRPEAHAAHHERGVHAYNFGFPIWDMLFGTFRNPPKGWQGTNGFWDGASNRVVPMLLGRDVSRMPEMPATALAGFVPSRLEVEPAANVMTTE